MPGDVDLLSHRSSYRLEVCTGTGILIRIPWEWNNFWCSDKNENWNNDVGMKMPKPTRMMPRIRQYIYSLMMIMIISVIIIFSLLLFKVVTN